MPGPPTLRDGLAWFAGRLGSSGAGALTAVEPRGADKPRPRGRLALNFAPADLALDIAPGDATSSGRRAWLAGEGLVQVVDVADPDQLRAVGHLARPGRVRAIAAVGRRVAVASADRRELRLFDGVGGAPASATLEGTVVRGLAAASDGVLVVVEELPRPQDGASLTP